MTAKVWDLVFLFATTSAAVAYLLVLTTYYAWWIVVLVSPLAFSMSVVIGALLWPDRKPLWIRVFWTVGGITLIGSAFTHENRWGSFFMGMALLQMGLFFCPQHEEPTELPGQ